MMALRKGTGERTSSQEGRRSSIDRNDQCIEIAIHNIHHLDIRVVEGYFYLRAAHCTKKLWQMGFISLPVRERLLTLHQLYTNTILHRVRFRMFKNQ